MKREAGHGSAGSRRRVRADDVADSQVCSGRSMRRKLLALASAWPLLCFVNTASAQPKPARVLIAWLNTDSRELSGQNLAAFKEGLVALGWKDGDQYMMEERWANGRVESLQSLADELAAKKPAIVLASRLAAVAPATNAAPATPIVFIGNDPVALGLVKSLARPGGMITGVISFGADLTGKHLEFLLAAVPKLKGVGILVDANAAARASFVEAARRSAAQYKVDARLAEVAKPEDIEPALARLAKEGAQALIVTGGLMLRNERHRIVKLALAQRWPVIGGLGGWAEAGALLSHAADDLANYRRAAYYVDRILKGAKPADLPIEQPTKFELTVNLKTAQALGIAIPQSILLRADKVIK